jgi:5-methylcytosine-specific restriction endonuclease McrA
MEIILRKLSARYPSYEAVFQMGSDRKERFHFNEPPGVKEKTDALNRFFGTPEVGVPQVKSCPVCKNHLMDRENNSTYHFGHIISRAMGGQNSASNLIPVCPVCNLACGPENMRDFCRKNYGRDFIF